MSAAGPFDPCCAGRARAGGSWSYGASMRFDRIFEDIEGRFDHEEREELRAVSEDLTRAERAQVTLADRLRAAGDRPVLLHLGQDVRVHGVVQEVGPDWVLLRRRAASDRALVPLGRIAMAEGLGPRARPAEEASPQLQLAGMLRHVARDRSLVRLETEAGSLAGRLAGVGADALELLSTPTGESSPVPGSARVTVALAALRLVLLP